MAMHTQNLESDPRASLLVTQHTRNEDPLAAGRVTLLGQARKLPEAEVTAARAAYLARHDKARFWVDFEDFAFWRLDLTDAYFVGGFAAMDWVTAEAYHAAAPDPLSEVALSIIDHMNQDHADTLPLYARAFAGEQADEATMTSVDRLGFTLRLRSGERLHGVRVAFPREVRTPMLGPSSSRCPEAAPGASAIVGLLNHRRRHPMSVHHHSPCYCRPCRHEGDFRRRASVDQEGPALRRPRGLAEMCQRPDVLLTSPLPRASETAEIAAEAWGGPPPSPEPVLAHGSAEDIIAMLARYAGEQQVVIVGHEPTVSEVLARLLGSTAGERFAFRKGGAAQIEVPGTGPRRTPGGFMYKALRALD
jgi:putative heme iron utilization protein/phosphohistidine phosphatase SixA